MQLTGKKEGGRDREMEGGKERGRERKGGRERGRDRWMEGGS